MSTVVQFFPQIYATFVHKTAGSVSVVTLAIQAPGNLAVVIYQLLSGSALATWLPFMSSFVQQTILITEIAFFDCFWNKRKKNEASLLSEEDNQADASVKSINDP